MNHQDNGADPSKTQITDRNRRRTRYLGALSVLAMLSFTGFAHAANITVNTTNMTVTNDALCGLSEAIVAVNTLAAYRGCPAGNGNSDTITLPAGTYSTFSTLDITRSLRIVGNGVGSSILNTGAIFGIQAAGASVTVQVSNMTVQRRSDQTFATHGFRPSDSTLVLDTVRVADFNAPGIFAEGSQVDIMNSLFENNTGSAITIFFGELNIIGTTFRNNPSSAVVASYELSSASAIALAIDNSRFENNSASQGAAVWIDGGTSAQMRVHNSVFANNHALNEGGAVYSKGQIYFFNTTFSGNTAVTGGGVHHTGAESYIYNSTFTDNTASSATGGLYARGGAKLYFSNIFANNTAPAKPDIDADNIAADYNLVRNINGYAVTSPHTHDILNQDPKLGILQDLGGNTLVHPLLFGSPAIDRIPTGDDSLQPTDQRGVPRPQDGDDGSGRASTGDIGAFEQGPYEAEFLVVANKTSGVTHSYVTNDANYSAGGGTRLDANANAQYVTYAVPVLETGTYSFRIRARRGANRGIYQVATADTLSGTYTNRGGVQDLYNAASDTTYLTLSSATVNFTSTGTKYIRFTVTGKNAASSSRNLYLDWVQLKKQ